MSELKRYYIAGGHLVSKPDGELCKFDDVHAEIQRLEAALSGTVQISRADASLIADVIEYALIRNRSMYGKNDQSVRGLSRAVMRLRKALEAK